MSWINNGDSGSSVRGKLNGIPNDGTNCTAMNAIAATVTASENIAAGALVNLYSSAGALRMRNANATDGTKPAHGFLLAAVTIGNSGPLYGPGQPLTGLSGLTPGTTYYLDVTSGALTATAPSSTGNIIQIVGVALSTNSLLFNPQVAPVQL